MTSHPLLMAPYHSGVHRFGWRFAASVVLPLSVPSERPWLHPLCGRDDGEIASFIISQTELAARLATPRHGPTGTVHDYRRGKGVRMPLNSLLYVPDPIPAIPELPMINFLRMIAGQGAPSWMSVRMWLLHHGPCARL